MLPGLKWRLLGGVNQDMSRALRFLVIIVVLLCGVLPARAAQGTALERGAAITDPYALRELDLGQHPTNGLDRVGFGLRPFIAAARTVAAPIFNDELFALPSMVPVRQAIDCFIPLAHGSYWPESSTAWTGHLSRPRHAVKFG